MAGYTRNNAWNNGGDFTNADLLWYAKGVGKMMSRALDDPASWWFFAAIHGEYVDPDTEWYVTPPQYPDWGFIDAPPKVPTSPLPASEVRALYWNQCQHQSWYFPPWHRGYLLALEAQLRADIVSLGGPADWALPYWNYFGGQDGSQYQMPPAFAAKTLPDGTSNPLFVAMRYGPDKDGNIYIPTAAGIAAHPNNPNFTRGPVTQVCMANDLYTGSDAVTKLPGFGGPETSFNHGDGTSGNLEGNPHNVVHVYVGGPTTAFSPVPGLMTDPGLAGLDPIFYLHHSNIDRMWAAWNAAGNANSDAAAWCDGPSPRGFIMPMPGGKSWQYTPADVDSLDELDYTYQELTSQAAPVVTEIANRLKLLGAPTAAQEVQAVGAPKALPKKSELLGANAAPLRLQGRGVSTAVQIDSGVKKKVVNSLLGASLEALPDRVYLKLENIRGTAGGAVFEVFVELPDTPPPGGVSSFHAGSVGLFGLRRASVADGQHAGSGLTFILDITRNVDQLHLARRLEAGTLRVSLVPAQPLPENADITVGRVSVFREGG